MSNGLSRRGQFRHDFWEHFRLRHPAAPIPVDCARAYVLLPLQTRTGRIRLGLSLRNDEVWIYVIGDDRETADVARPKLDPHEAALVRALGPLASDTDIVSYYWYAKELRLDTGDRANWDPMADWLDDMRQTYENVLNA